MQISPNNEPSNKFMPKSHISFFLFSPKLKKLAFTLGILSQKIYTKYIRVKVEKDIYIMSKLVLAFLKPN
eukprot:c43531_g1_i1 orf=35-244(+)